MCAKNAVGAKHVTEVSGTKRDRLAVRLDALGGSAAAIAAALDDAAADRIMALKMEIAATARAVEVEAGRPFAADPLPVGDLAWQALWGAAQAYCEAHAHLGDRASVRAIAAGDPCVKAVPRLLTMQLAPRRVLLNVDIRFRPDMSGSALVEAVDRLEARIQEAHPQVEEIFIEIEALRAKGRS